MNTPFFNIDYQFSEVADFMYGSVYPNMSRHTSFRQRKSGNNNDNMKKMLSIRKCSTLSNTLAFPPFSSQVNPISKCGLVQTKICITHSLPLLEDPAIITGSLDAPRVGQADTCQVGTLVGYNHPNRGGQGGEGGYGSGPYPPQGRGAPYGSSGMPGAGPRGGGGGGYSVGGPNYPQGGPYSGSGASRGSNMMGGNRNQQYGWQQ